MRSIVRTNKTDGEKGGGGAGGDGRAKLEKGRKGKRSFRGGASQPFQLLTNPLPPPQIK